MIFSAIELVSPVDKSDLPRSYDGVSINLYQSISDGEFNASLAQGNCIATLMSDLSLNLPEHIQIAALLHRCRPNLVMYIKDAAIDMSVDYRLIEGATFSADHPITAAQIMDLRDDVLYITNDDVEVDAIIKWEKDQGVEMEGYQKFVLHTKDMIPPVGTGIIAVVVSDENKDLRKAIQADHNKILGSCSNVERTLAKMCVQNGIQYFAAFCETDTNGYYHASACALVDEEFKKATISQSTYADIANQLFHQLTH